MKSKDLTQQKHGLTADRAVFQMQHSQGMLDSEGSGEEWDGSVIQGSVTEIEFGHGDALEVKHNDKNSFLQKLDKAKINAIVPLYNA